MNLDKIIDQLDHKMDYMGESKMMHNRYWVHRAAIVMRKLINHKLSVKPIQRIIKFKSK